MTKTLKTLLGLPFITLLLFGFLAKAQKQPSTNKPNIIYILVDDLGYGDVGFTGQKHIKTPNLDKIAAEGMIFTNSYTGSTVCGPSRVSLMLGKHTGHSPVRENPAWTAAGKAIDISDKDVTVAEELKRAGYATAVIGKWGLAENAQEGLPTKQGFDYFYGFADHRSAHHYYPEKIWENDKEIAIPGNITAEKKGTYSQDIFTSKAVDYLKNIGNKPFFLYLAYTIPHFELTVPEESKKPYENLGWPKQMMKATKGYRHDAEGNVTYAGMVSRMDDYVGKIMQLLKDKGIDDNTIVIFSSDNGPEFNKRNNEFFNSTGVFRGQKRDLYEGGIRTPFAIRWPNEIKAGSKSDHIITFWDFLPTACGIAGIAPSDKSIDGLSYYPTLVGNSKDQKKHDFLYWEFNERGGPKQAIRKDNWKAIKLYEQPIALYDIVKDPGEKNNLAAKQPEIIKEMAKLFLTARTENPNFPLVPKAIKKENQEQD